jgi:uncharacterized membrane protein YraQ (UPF0718 family)
LDNAFTLFISLLVEAMPFLLLGVLLSSALALGIDEGKLVKSLPRHPFWGALVGSGVGFLFPVCECGNVPVARRLLLQGMPSSVALGFLLAAPTINPVVIWSTWVAFRDQPAIVVGRVVFSLAIAVFLATLFSLEKDPHAWLQPSLAKRLEFLNRLDLKEARGRGQNPGGQSLSLMPSGGTGSLGTTSLLSSGTFIIGEEQPLEARLAQSRQPNKSWRVFLDNVSQEMRELGGMLIIGSAIAAGIQAFVPREIILNIGQDPLTSILAMLLLAVVVSICSTVDAFFALSFVGSFTSSSLLAFLVLGPIVDLKAMGLMLSIFKPRIILYLFAMATQLTFLLTLAHSYLF